MAAASFGTTSQVIRFLQAHGLQGVDIDRREDVEAARELIAEERGKRGLPSNSPFSARIAPVTLLVHAEEDITPLPFGPAGWAMLHHPTRFVKRTS